MAGLLLNMIATRGDFRAILERYVMLECNALHKAHSELNNNTPYAMMHAKKADLSLFRAIRAKAFVNDTHC